MILDIEKSQELKNRPDSSLAVSEITSMQNPNQSAMKSSHPGSSPKVGLCFKAGFLDEDRN